MKQHFSLQILLFICCIVFLKCGADTPEKSFNIAVLNTNMLVGFAGRGFLMQLESPSVKLKENGNETETMTRTDVINSQIEFTETNLSDLNGIKETDENKDMIKSSTALHEYILPVYKNEYMQLAELFDRNAPKDQIESLSEKIKTKYYPGFKEKYDELIAAGKQFAEKKNIKVNWN